MKDYRFIKEYANYKIGRIRGNDLMLEEYKDNIIADINKWLRLYQRSLITVDEVMQKIAEV